MHNAVFLIHGTTKESAVYVKTMMNIFHNF